MLIADCYLCVDMVKTFSILTRGVSGSHIKKLKKQAKKQRCSVNFLMLRAIDYYLDHTDLAVFKTFNKAT